MQYIIAIFAVLFTLNVNAETPSIVSGDGSLTEVIYALHAEKMLAGVDTTSMYPEAATKLPQIGYKRNISSEGVLSLSPDILLVTEDAGTDKSLNQLNQAGLKIKSFSAAPTLDAVKQKILGVAELINKPKAGQALWEQVKAKVDAARAKNKDRKNRTKVMFVLSDAGHSPIVGGQGTHADSMITMAGGINAVTGIKGYKPITAEAIASANPDVILIMQHGGHAIDQTRLLTKPGFKLTNAAKEKRVIGMDGLYLLGFGPRIGDAVATLSDALYPTR